MPLQCAILDDYQGVALGMADWSPLAGRVELRVLREHVEPEEELAERLADCEIVVIMRERTPFPASLFARLPRLRLLVTSGLRNAAIDLGAAARHGVTVCGTPSGSEPPAELAWALILGLARHLVVEATALRGNGRWQQTVGMELAGRRLGLLGLGKIGGRMAHVGRAFGMEVVGWSPNLSPERAAEVGARRVEKEELFATSDVVSIHLVLGARSRGLVGEAELRRMRPGAFLVNTSRAGIVDRAALLTALTEGWIAGAGLDVFEVEPLPPDDPLRLLPNVLATPHLGYVAESNYRAYFRGAVENIEAFLHGAPLRVLSP